MTPRRAALAALVALSVGFVACAPTSESMETGEDAIVSRKVDDHWFYSGPIPQLDDPQITASMTGHTVRVSGLLPSGASLPPLPHVKTKTEGSRTRVDIVYPIATAGKGKSNSKAGSYAFHGARPYRPNGQAYTESQGWHDVPWGGFPFIAYNGGIAFHGPITDRDNEAAGDLNVWYLRRGKVSGGCNRMMGEHVVELTHIIGINMRKIYKPNTIIPPTTTAAVRVIDDYDTYDGKYIDVDYPTDQGAVRPATTYGTERVAMFGSWILSEMPNGEDLPPDTKWEGGVSGKFYDFQAHSVRGYVCSMPPASLGQLSSIAARSNGVLPSDFCQRKLACDNAHGRICSPAEIGL